ncbi:unnamed protein product [Nesidiocoris tenuis]|uniref:Protein kinase domain-containing protein n=1 Tax=Nesidiocoris tenuis TaxID=355587 RepID=A0A6H5H158_9HEMI|nr:unnamed protein product [Nesidiocoris tenuis]
MYRNQAFRHCERQNLTTHAQKRSELEELALRTNLSVARNDEPFSSFCLSYPTHEIEMALAHFLTNRVIIGNTSRAAGGELQRVVDIQDGLEEAEAVVVMKQVLEALKFLHDLNIAHLDLKPQNMLLTRDYPDTDIVLCDFGISRVIQDGVEVREILGTPDYVAPEVLNYEPISLATDIWSVGVLAYVLLSGYSPFAGDTKQQTFCNISQCSLSFPTELFDGVSPSAIHFIRSTLVVDPRSVACEL